MVCCRCCFCCCRICSQVLEPSQQERQEAQAYEQNRQIERQRQLQQQQQQQQQRQQAQAPRQAQPVQRAQSWRSRLSMSSHGSDLPPPYEEGVAGSQSRAPRPQAPATQATKLPYAIPLASFMDDAALLDTISKVHTADLSAYGISQEHFLTFYYELDKRLSHQTEGQPGMLNNVMTILQPSGEGAQIGVRSDPKIESFVGISNQDLFHPAGLHVEVLGGDATKHKIKLSPELEEDKDKTMKKLAKIEEKIAKLAQKFDEELPKATNDHERSQIQAEYDTKRTKLRGKASVVLAEYNQKSDAELFDGLKPSGAASQEGPLWLVVSARSDA